MRDEVRSVLDLRWVGLVRFGWALKVWRFSIGDVKGGAPQSADHPVTWAGSMGDHTGMTIIMGIGIIDGATMTVAMRENDGVRSYRLMS